ncbi:ferrous iron transport protein B [Bradyrhizobium liaoningense]
MELPLLHLALVGTPNSGKTSLFNALTGSRQKVANYPGVTVERKEGFFVTPLGRQVSVVDLPGTYSLRGRSPDEEITRDFVLGKASGETVPDLVLCVADSTNLRLTIRLLLELKRTGRPMILVLNMFDIASRRGITVDVERLAKELGVPVVTSIAVRKGGTADLLQLTDDISAKLAEPQENSWRALSVSELRATQREADRIIADCVSLPARPDTWTARIDAVVLHPVGGLIVLALILFVMFQAVFAWAQPLMDLLNSGFDALGEFIQATLPGGLLQSFLQNGVISGVGSVIVFLPQIIIIFLFILLLEDFGYMARAAFLMDRIMGGAGLHGRAFIPLLSSFACAIPGIMATRVIDNKRDRLTTILIAPLMTCSARIPVYTLIISAFIPARDVWGFINLQGLVMFGLYAAGIISALLVSFLIKFFMLRDFAPAPFMLELPDYKMPRLKSIAIGIYTRAKMFLQRAGTTIFSMMVLIWFLASFPQPPAGATEPAIDFSLAAIIGKAMEPLLAPVGFNWQIAVALIPGMAAREVAVASPRHRLCDRGRQGSGRADRPGAGDEMVAGDRAVAAGLVHLRPAMRLDAGRDPARDRKLGLDGRNLRLHAGASLCGEPRHVQRRGRVRGGIALARSKTRKQPHAQ